MGFRLGKPKYQIWSFILPFLYCLITYTLIWTTGLGHFYNAEFGENVSGDLSKIVGFNLHLPFAAFIFFGILWIFVSALGEEIGWRGFLVPQLAKFNSFSKTALFSGIIWAIWHYPLIFFTDYNSGTNWFGVLCFTIMIIGLSFAFAWLRLKSNSVWTGVLLHAGDNLFVQGVFNSLTAESGMTKYIIGEFGIALAIAAVVVGYIFWTKRSAVEKLQTNTRKTSSKTSKVFSAQKFSNDSFWTFLSYDKRR